MKILVVLPRYPFPLEKGDKLRAYNQIRELAQRNEVYLFCVTHSKVTAEQQEALSPFCRAMKVVQLNRAVCYKNVVRNWFASKSLQMGYWDSKRSRRLYKQFEHEVQPDVIFSQMVRTMPLVARSSCPKVMDFQDALSMNPERRMEQAKGLWRYILHYEFKMLRSSEYKAFSIFDALTIISETDSEAIPHKKNGDIKVIRNGVDLEYFRPMEHRKDYAVVFCGNMQYHPNVDAAQYLVNEVMPLVWARHPEARVLLAGATPKAVVRQLASHRVTVSGTVADMRPCYASAQLFVAPMRVGSGLQNKLLEAMAMGIPCVTTPLANAALNAVNGETVLIGETPTELADSIVALLDNASLCKQLADNAHTFVGSQFSWHNTGLQLEQVLANAITTHHHPYEKEQLENRPR